MEVTQLSVGDIFSSFADLDKKLKSYQSTNYVQLWKRDSRTIATAQKRMPNRQFNPDIKYYELWYACVHGGRSHTSKSQGQRPNQSTFKVDCPYQLKLRSSEDGQNLVITKYVSDHNHDVSKPLYNLLPSQRRLDQSDKERAAEMLKVGANRKMVCHQFSKTTGKSLFIKDIHNIATAAKPKPSTGVSELQQVADYLKSQPGLSTEYLIDENNTLSGIFIQDSHMQHTFSQFPELVLADATHKTNELRMPFYLMTTVDGNGETEIIAAFIVTSEEEHMIRQMIQIFKTKNPKWTDIKVILTDKDMVERTVFSEEIPNSNLQICLFHVLRTFKREITTEKMGITGGERTTVLEIIQKLAYSRSENEYNTHYEELQATQLHNVLRYYDTNWDHIRKQWVEGLKHQQMSMGERTNNRLESQFQKLKSMTSSHHSLLEFLATFLSFLQIMRTERDRKVAQLFYKVPCSVQQRSASALQYQQYLTPHAFKYVEKQLDLAQHITIQEDEVEAFVAESSEGIVSVTTTSCQCTFHKSMYLPCRHIFALRAKQSIELFASELVAKRWTMQNYKNSHRMFTPLADSIHEQPTVCLTPRRRPLTANDKYKRALLLGQKLASLTAECGQDYEQRLCVLEDLTKMWEAGKQAVIVEVIMQDLPPSNSDMQVDQDPSMTLPTHDALPDLQNDQQTLTEFVTEPSTTTQEPETPTTPELNQPSAVPEPADPVLENVNLPPKSKKRGRPKGSNSTVIGLPKKKSRYNTPTPFIKKSPSDRDLQILGYFVCEKDATRAVMGGERLSEDAVQQNPSAIPTACLDENVSIQKVHRYFDPDGWKAVQHVYAAFRSSAQWLCELCRQDLTNMDSVVCDCCLQWVHLKCIGKRTMPKTKFWFCRDCYA